MRNAAQRFIVVSGLLLILLTSCSMPETKIYSLVVPEEKAVSAMQTDTSLSVTVNSPRYLSQSYIAYRTSPYQIEVSRYSRWDTSPTDLVREAFRDALSSAGIFNEVKSLLIVPSGYYNLDVHLKRFERVDEGEASFALLLLEIKLRSPEGRELYTKAISRRTRLADKTFLGLAKALSEALYDEIGKVKADVAVAMKGPK